MKTILSLIFAAFALVAPAIAQVSSAGGISFAASSYYTTYDPAHVTLTPDGVFKHAPDVKIKLLMIREDQLTIECERTYLISVGGTIIDPLWREVYVVQDGKFHLKEIQIPKVTPAQDEKIDWDNATIAYKGAP